MAESGPGGTGRSWAQRGSLCALGEHRVAPRRGKLSCRAVTKVTKENVEEASKEVAEDEDVSPEFYAKMALREVRRWAKKAERVGWVLPRLEKEVA